MPTVRRSPIEAVLTAVITTLKNSSGLTAVLGSSTGIYNEVPQGAAYPFLEVTSPTDRREDTFGRFGSSVLVDCKAVSQAFGDQEPSRLTDQVIRTLNFATLATTQHTALGITWEQNERYADVVNGIKTRYHVTSFRVWTEQSSS